MNDDHLTFAWPERIFEICSMEIFYDLLNFITQTYEGIGFSANNFIFRSLGIGRPAPVNGCFKLRMTAWQSIVL